MKKLLLSLGSLGMVVSAGATAVACSSSTDERAKLDTLITVTALGTIETNSQANILAAANTQNAFVPTPEISTYLLAEGQELTLNDVEVINITDKSATIKALDSSELYKGSVNVTFESTNALTSLDTYIEVTEFGELVNNEDATLITAINDYNTAEVDGWIDLTASDISFSEVTSTSAKVTAIDGSNYTGSTTIKFSIIKTNLTTVIETKDLGEIANNSAAAILAEVNAKNSTTLELNTDVTIINIGDTNATVKAASDSIYTGEVEVTFTIAVSKTPLANEIDADGSYEVTEATEASILAKVNEVNSKSFVLNTDVTIEITETDATAGTAAITAVASSSYEGSVTINYTVATATK